jgi:hypothetical protein
VASTPVNVLQAIEPNKNIPKVKIEIIYLRFDNILVVLIIKIDYTIGTFYVHWASK